MTSQPHLTPCPLAVTLKQSSDGAAIVVRSNGALPSLSMMLPALGNMGLRVLRQEGQSGNAGSCELWLEPESAARLNDVEDVEALCQFLKRLFDGEAEDGRLNGLALVASCTAHEVMLVRAAASYLRQGGLHLSLRYIAERLREYPAALRCWLALFKARFDPSIGADRKRLVDQAQSALQEAQSQIGDSDTFDLFSWLRTFALGTVRTNYFSVDQAASLPPYLAFKIDGSLVSFLPAPRPFREMFVFSERFEGVHLRGGPVARGGLRWSDRREDYRTEVLGLVKAQLVKNAVIVPTGAKGGFVCKAIGPHSARDAIAAEGRDVYRLFVGALLDLTDNQVSDGGIVPPSGVVCHDGADPYLVVAADKGTATFSDLANRIANERGFWLGDAFASGGSVGYDHKKLGITAKGAWETAKIRFREEGGEWNGEAFTAVGIGDMSGDVFGNGTLLQPTMRLVAAFDHRHIFIDPQPAIQQSYEERARLFQLERSSWDDYDRRKISHGGGVWSRAERTIRLSPQAQEALGVYESDISPDALIRAILAAPVTVLYNGGIGTYIKASHESDEAARDRNNDRVRIDARQVRARIVVEGGNLGLTQAARIELAERGHHVYTDAVDNSGGVDCSDHEVNIKIALALDADHLAQRESILPELSAEVEQAVLSTNRDQARRIARHVRHPGLLPDAARYLDSLTHSTGLHRALEGLPDDATLKDRPNHALLAPEIAVVMAHSKMSLKSAWVLEAATEMTPWHLLVLCQYFPVRLRNLPLQRHPLAKQIVATSLANDAVNRMGIGVVERISEECQSGSVAVLDAYAFGCTALRIDTESLGDARVALLPAADRHAHDAKVEGHLGEMVACLLRNPGLKDAKVWRELRSMFPRVPDHAQEPAATLGTKVEALLNLGRAMPLLDLGLSVQGAVSLMHEVELETGLNEVLQRLAEQDNLRRNALFVKWIQRTFSLIALRVAALAHRIHPTGGAHSSAVKAALERLGWRDSLDQIRAICKSDWEHLRLERVLNVVARLDEDRILEGVAFDTAGAMFGNSERCC